ncbi:FtsX-like permease family protein [Paenibacillus sp. NPDC058071]|uniref:FtsX-like permease family protein n=1 Tax=Paenibacillus sp. NPDC058071 TaxID=3346326 RepID=UPI0036DD75C2
MILSLSGLALRFFGANKFIAAACVTTVSLAVSLIVTMMSFSIYVRQSAAGGSAGHAEAARNLQSYQVYTIVLSILVIVVTALLLIANFQQFLYKNKNELAILRSIGASTGQMVRLASFQCGLISLVGAGLGYFIAWLTHQFVYRKMGALFNLTSDLSAFPYAAAFITAAICAVAIWLAMLLPSFRSLKELPVQIWQRNEENDFTRIKASYGLPAFSLAAGAALLVAGHFWLRSPLFILLSGLLTVIGLLAVLPLYLSVLLAKLAPLLKLVFGRESYVAVRNVIPQVRRNTFVIVTVSTMLVIAVFGSAFFKTVRTNEQYYINRLYPAPIVIGIQAGEKSDIDPAELLAAISRLPSVQEASTTSTAAAIRLAKNGRYIDYQLADLKGMERQGLLHRVPDQPERAIFVSKETALSNNLKIGETIELRLTVEMDQYRSYTVEIADILNEIPGSYVDAYMDWSNELAGQSFLSFEKAYVSANDVDSALRQLEGIRHAYPELNMESYDQAMKRSEQMFYQRWYFFVAALVVVLVSVIVGVFTMLVNHVYSKRKEYAILRAIAVDRAGIRKIIVTQAVLYVLIGIIQGIAIGMLLTYILSLIDSSGLVFDYKLISIMGTALTIAAVLVFSFVGHQLGNRRVTLELRQE